MLALIRDAIVSYIRPFSKNRGRIFKKIRLDDCFVPSKHKALHKDLLRSRDQVFAHTDIDAHDPTLARFPVKSGYIYPIAFRNLSVKSFVDKLPEISALIQEVHNAINAEKQIIESQWLDTVKMVK